MKTDLLMSRKIRSCFPIVTLCVTYTYLAIRPGSGRIQLARCAMRRRLQCITIMGVVECQALMDDLSYRGELSLHILKASMPLN